MEKRKYPRVPGKLKFFYKADYIDQKDWSFGWISNISVGGAFLQLPNVLPVGSKLMLRLPLKLVSLGSTVCNFPAKVVWESDSRADKSGMVGISFVHDPLGQDNDRLALTRFIREHKQTKEIGESRVKVRSGAHSTQNKMNRLMREAIKKVDKKTAKKKGFFSKIFGNS